VLQGGIARLERPGWRLLRRRAPGAGAARAGPPDPTRLERVAGNCRSSARRHGGPTGDSGPSDRSQAGAHRTGPDRGSRATRRPSRVDRRVTDFARAREAARATTSLAGAGDGRSAAAPRGGFGDQFEVIVEPTAVPDTPAGRQDSPRPRRRSLPPRGRSTSNRGPRVAVIPSAQRRSYRLVCSDSTTVTCSGRRCTT
jgi:hypothetical protein